MSEEYREDWAKGDSLINFTVRMTPDFLRELQSMATIKQMCGNLTSFDPFHVLGLSVIVGLDKGKNEIAIRSEREKEADERNNKK